MIYYAGKTSYYTYDGRGSVSDVLNSNGDVQLTYAYTEFGKTTTFFSEHVDNPYRYNAECVDYVPGIPDFQYLRARYYAPHEGRFIQQDTLFGDVMVPLSQNLYAYAMNNPLSFIDPSGHYNIPLSIEMAGPEAIEAYLIGTGQKKKPAEEKKEVADKANGKETTVQREMTTSEKKLLEQYNDGKLPLSVKMYFDEVIRPKVIIDYSVEPTDNPRVRDFNEAETILAKTGTTLLAIISGADISAGAGFGIGVEVDGGIASISAVGKRDVISLGADGTDGFFAGSTDEASAGVSLFGIERSISSTITHKYYAENCTCDLVGYNIINSSYVCSAWSEPEVLYNDVSFGVSMGAYVGVGGSISAEYRISDTIKKIKNIWSK